MRVLVYSDVDPDQIPGFDKVRAALEADNFTQADVRKIGPDLWRARLNRSDRLLFTLRRYQGTTCALVLEHIPNHDYAHSRFLRGAVVDEDKIPPLAAPPTDGVADIVYVNPRYDRFHLLDKLLSFDDEQHAVLDAPAPMLVIGSAGSGKTALILEKMKRVAGDVLYVSLSPYLVRNARNLYYANSYDNEDQQAEFLSFREFLESVRALDGREVTLKDVQNWFARHRRGSRLSDAHKLFEEFRGVITGPLSDRGFRTREEYLALGVKQSIFLDEERSQVYDLFEKYLTFLDEEKLLDANVLAHRYLSRVEARWDFVVVDEVQDVTTVQLYLLLKSLRAAGAFLLSGDSNQIVHPNFFSWSSVKSLFFREQALTGGGAIVRVLHANYRSAPVVTAAANRILKLKHARFGSVDRESNYLVRSTGEERGRLQLLADTEPVKRDLDARTARSTRFAVIVMHPEQKAEAAQWFTTPLLFSIQEAKGLEYESVVLYNFVAGEATAFRAIATGVDPEALDGDDIDYARGRDKRDKSLEVYKFYINALYVAMTRAVRNLYVVEADHAHPALRLLQLDRFAGDLDVDREQSSLDDWRREARKLELQGKTEQADAIRARILEQAAVPWQPLDRAAFAALRADAVAGRGKVQLEVFEYAQIHHHRPVLNELAKAGFKPAQRDDLQANQHLKRHFTLYDLSNPTAALREVDRYGVDHRTRFNLTPLMIAASLGNEPLVQALIERGADLELRANNGFTALHFALDQAFADDTYMRRRMARMYRLLEPDAVNVQVDNRLVKLDKRLMETLLLHVLMALHYRVLGPEVARSAAMCTYSAPTLTTLLEKLPDSVLPPRRKRRAYVSGILSRNERDRDGPYNRKLFLRWRHGQYVLNPGLQLRVGERWTPLHDVLPPEDLGPRRIEHEITAAELHSLKLRNPSLLERHNRDREIALEVFCTQLQRLAAPDATMDDAF